MTVNPATGWTATAFDDTTWPAPFLRQVQQRRMGRAGRRRHASPYLRQLCLRGKFTDQLPGRGRPVVVEPGLPRRSDRVRQRPRNRPVPHTFRQEVRPEARVDDSWQVYLKDNETVVTGIKTRT